MTATGTLLLEDGSRFPGTWFGADVGVAGEVVFNTGMVGYPETLTDPSYTGQILVCTYPLIGNYGVPSVEWDADGLLRTFEATSIRIRGLVVATLAADTSHWSASQSLHEWMAASGIPGLAGVDTRALTKRLRERGVMLGKLVREEEDVPWHDPNLRNLVAEASPSTVTRHGRDGPRVILVDMGAKEGIARSLVAAGARVIRVPWDHDFFDEDFDGVCLSNGPGDPKMAERAVEHTRRALAEGIPMLGVCLGNQVMALAAGADTYKLKYGHRSQNQPCVEVGTDRCHITSQNHGYAVDATTLPPGWREWFRNANDGSNEGIRHESLPARAVQFHPEASPGPTDTASLFADFVRSLR